MSFIDDLIKKIDKPSYLFVGGGVASGIGKGITISSLAVNLQQAGYTVSTIKIDPYLNVDAGTMSPWEHGEVFILKDGGEVDLDLGNYERYLDESFTMDNNITSGKVYDNIIRKERNGDYLGKTVQFFPHVAQEIINLIYNVGNKPHKKTGLPPNIVLVELGGTVGDVESIMFYEAVRQIMLEKSAAQTFFLMVTFVPFFNTTGEQKTKPTQNAILALRMTGITLNYLVLRSRNPLEQSQINKIAGFANLKSDHVLNIPDLESVHQVPVCIEQNNLPYLVMKHFGYPLSKCKIQIYKDLHNHIKNVIKKKPPVKIAVVGKYVGIEDAYISLKKAIESACLASDVPVVICWVRSELLEDKTKKEKPEVYAEKWEQLKSCGGIIIPGGYDIRGFEGKIAAINYARTQNVPILGICYGFQTMCIEYARNVMGVKNATSYEVSVYRNLPQGKDESKEDYEQRCQDEKKLQKKEVYVIDDMPDASLTELGGTMRKGAKDTFIKDKKTLAYKLYNKEILDERYRHRFEVALDWQKKFVKAGLIFSGLDESGKRMEILELKKHKFFFGVQYHPEFLSRNFKPSPPFLGLIQAVLGTLDQNIKKNGHLCHEYYWAKEEQ